MTTMDELSTLISRVRAATQAETAARARMNEAILAHRETADTLSSARDAASGWLSTMCAATEEPVAP